MSPADAMDLLATVQSFDKRTVGEFDGGAWHAALGDLRLEECRRAVVKHYATETGWIMPAHVRRLVSAERHDAAARQAVSSGTDHHGRPLVTRPDWFDSTVKHYMEQSRADRAAAKERGEPVTFGDAIVLPQDRMPR